MTSVMDIYTYDALQFIAEKEMELFNKIKKYFAENQETIVAGLSSLNGNYYNPALYR